MDEAFESQTSKVKSPGHYYLTWNIADLGTFLFMPDPTHNGSGDINLSCKTMSLVLCQDIANDS